MINQPVIIGGITLDGFETPEIINFGGSQRLSKKQLVGGARQVDALGWDQDDIQWSGRFRGSSALQRCQAIEGLAIIGLPITVTYLGLNYKVLIAQFRADLQRMGYEIPYSIVLSPTVGESPPAQTQQGIDSLFGFDLSGVTSFISDAESSVTGVFADMAPELQAASSALTTVTQAVGGLSGLAGLPFSKVSGILTGLNNANTAIGGAITIGNGNIFTGASQIGGVVPAGPTSSAAALPSQIQGLQARSNLIVARGQTGRAINNVSNAGAST
jgi:hypothetical protein